MNACSRSGAGRSGVQGWGGGVSQPARLAGGPAPACWRGWPAADANSGPAQALPVSLAPRRRRTCNPGRARACAAAQVSVPRMIRPAAAVAAEALQFPLEGNGLASFQLDKPLAQAGGRPWLVAGPPTHPHFNSQPQPNATSNSGVNRDEGVPRQGQRQGQGGEAGAPLQARGAPLQRQLQKRKAAEAAEAAGRPSTSAAAAAAAAAAGDSSDSDIEMVAEKDLEDVLKPGSGRGPMAGVRGAVSRLRCWILAFES
jgi:hypothetical protein